MFIPTIVCLPCNTVLSLVSSISSIAPTCHYWSHSYIFNFFYFFFKDHFPKASSWSVSYTHNLSELNLSAFKLNKCISLLSSIFWPPNPSIFSNPLLQIICQPLPRIFKTSPTLAKKINPFVPNFPGLEKDTSVFPVLKSVIPSFKDHYTQI